MRDEEASNYYNFLKNIKRLGDRTIFEYIKQWRRLPPEELTQESINQYIADCKNTDVARAFMKSYLAFRGLHKTLELPPRRTGREKIETFRAIPKEDWKRLIEFIYSKSFKDGVIVELIYQGALRRVEVPTIKVNSFHWMEWIARPEGFLKLTVLGKNNKERNVLINPETAQRIFLHFVEENKLNDDSMKAFFNSQSKMFNIVEIGINDMLRRYAKKVLEGRKVRPHDLRRQRATELLERGVPIHDIKNYLGHSNVATTEKYIKQAEGVSISNVADILSS